MAKEATIIPMKLPLDTKAKVNLSVAYGKEDNLRLVARKGNLILPDQVTIRFSFHVDNQRAYDKSARH